jgi:signal transduction histidine kinase
VKFSPQEGEIIVACTRPAADVVQIAVQDCGIGLATSELEHVFERFYQVNASERTVGLGLGLYISREIVERHEGRIWAESPPDGGARFVVELPDSQAH